jgi:hypothetical protein
MTSVARFGKIAKHLGRMGHDPIPIIPGTKAPRPKGWQDGDFADRAHEFENDFTGIRTRTTPAIDIDVSDPDLVRQIVGILCDVLGCREIDLPARVGNAPRTLLVCRTDQPFTKQVTATYELPTDPIVDGKLKRSIVEVLADGQQFVAYAVHPDTHQPYGWITVATPMNTHEWELVTINAAQAAEIIRRCDALLAKHGKRHGGSSTTGTAVDPPGEIDLQAREDAMRYPDTPANRARLLSALKSLDPDADPSRDGRYMTIIYGLHSTGWTDWRELAESWATGEMHGITSTEYDEEKFRKDVKGLNTNKPKAIKTVASIFWLAANAGWIDPRSVNLGEGGHPLAQFISLDAEPKAPRMVIPGLIAHGLGIIAGAHGVGKTTTTLPLSMVAAGLHRQGDPLAPKHWRHVIYITEDPEQARRILAGIVKFGGLGLDPATVRERLHIVEARRLEPAYVAEVATVYREQFARVVDGVEVPPLVVIDTKAAVFSMEDENSNSEASAIVAMLKQSFENLPVWLVGHVAKANLTRTDVAGLTLRGASAFEADANQVLYLVKEGEQRYLVLGKTRFEPRWSEVLIQSRTATTIASDEFGDMYPLVLRWGIASPPEQSRKAAQEKAQEAQREAETTALRGEVLDVVEVAWQAGFPLNREGVKARVRRNRKEVTDSIEILLSELWLCEVPIPTKERTHPKRSAFLVTLTTEERESTIKGQGLPAAKLVVPESWRKDGQTVRNDFGTDGE